MTAAAAALVIVTTACSGGGDDTSGSDSTPTPNTSSEDVDAATASPVATETPTESEGSEVAGGADDFSQLFADRMAATWQVDYQITSAPQTFTLINDPPNSAVAVDGQLVLVTNADGSFACQANGQCQPAPDVDPVTVIASLLGTYGVVFQADFEDRHAGALLDSTTDTVAGRSALCKQVSESVLTQDLAGEPVPEDATIDVCIDEETGAVLRALHTADGETSGIEATSVSATVDPAVFEVD